MPIYINFFVIRSFHPLVNEVINNRLILNHYPHCAVFNHFTVGRNAFADCKQSKNKNWMVEIKAWPTYLFC